MSHITSASGMAAKTCPRRWNTSKTTCRRIFRSVRPPARCRKRLGVIGLGLGFSQSADDAFAAQSHHGVEERRRDGLADDGHARGVDEQAGLYAGGFGDGARGEVARIMIPIGKFFERAGKIREQL